MTRQARPVIDRCKFLCDLLSAFSPEKAVVPHVHDSRQYYQPTADDVFKHRVVAGNEVADTPHMTDFLGFILHGPMGKASAYGAENSRFEPWCGSLHFCCAGKPVRV